MTIIRSKVGPVCKPGVIVKELTPKDLAVEQSRAECRKLIFARLQETRRLLDELYYLDARELLLDTMVELADLIEREGLDVGDRNAWEEADAPQRSRMSMWKQSLLDPGTTGGSWYWHEGGLRSQRWNVTISRLLVERDPWQAVDMICEAVRAGERVLRASLTERLVGVVEVRTVSELSGETARAALDELGDRLAALELDLGEAGLAVGYGLELRLGPGDFVAVTNWMEMTWGRQVLADTSVLYQINLVSCTCILVQDPHVPRGRGLVLLARGGGDPVPGR